MGLFRRTRAADPAGSAPAGDGSAAPATAAAPEPAAPEPDPGPAAWESLPPIATTTAAPAATFKIGAAVKDDLVALDSPRLSHGMGHLVSADGPPGIVSGLAAAGVQRTVGEPRPDGGAVAPSEALDMPVVQRRRDGDGDGNGDGEHHEHDGHDHGAHAAVLVPRTVPGEWTPPANPLVAPGPPPPERRLPVAPTPVPMPLPLPAPVQRRADETAPAEVAVPRPAEDLPSVPVARPPDPRPPAEAAPVMPVQRAASDLPLAVPVPAPAPPALHGPAVQRRAAVEAPDQPAPVAEETPITAPADTIGGDAPTDGATVTGTTGGESAAAAAGGGIAESTGSAGTTETAGPTEPGGASETAGPGGAGASGDAPTLQRMPTSLPAPAAPLVPPAPTVPPIGAAPAPGELPLAGGAGGPTVQRRADESEGTFRPRLGGVGPPTELPASQRSSPASPTTTSSPTPPATLAAPVTVQRSAAPSPAPAGDMDLVIRQRPRGSQPDAPVVARMPDGAPDTVVRSTLGVDGGLRPDDPGDAATATGTAYAPVTDTNVAGDGPLALAAGAAVPTVPEVPAAPVAPTAAGLLVPPAARAAPVHARAPVQRRLDRLPSPEAISPWLSAPPTSPAAAPAMPLAPRGRSSAAAVSGGGTGVAALTAQRSLASPPALTAAALGSAAVNGHPPPAPAMPTWPVPSGGGAPTVQRWADLGSARDLGRGAFDAASTAVTDRAAGARDAVGDAVSGFGGGAESLLGSAPDLPTLPGAPDMPQMPEMPLAGPPRLPQMPQMTQFSSMPSLPGAPSLPDMPAQPGGGGAAVQTVAGAADVPMREITFPAPEAPAPAPAAAPAGGGAAGAPAGAGAGASSTELDDLAHKLYDRIRWRLRTELRLDLERTGLGAGVRR
jgi:hypothetical protein